MPASWRALPAHRGRVRVQFGVKPSGHFNLTGLLIDVLKAPLISRVVTVSAHCISLQDQFP